MKKIYSTTAALFTLLAAGVLSAPVAYGQLRAPQPIAKITQVQVFGGWNCPDRVLFMGKVFVTAPLTITYQWQRSDGTTTPVKTAQVAAPFNHPLLDDDWDVRGRVPNLPSGDIFRDTLHILTPQNVPTQTTEVHLQCK